jgi:phosphodiesterase/alkaline phosphatase D-like protein
MDDEITNDVLPRLTRRALIQAAAALGATGLWARGASARPRWTWHEQRNLYPQGVASGDPRQDSVILWTRRPGGGGVALDVEIAEDEAFSQIVARASAMAEAASDWTVRVLVGGLKPAREYWYRFVDAEGGSRVGRTVTAPSNADKRPVQFAFVSCQDITQGAQNAYRRMIWEDERAKAGDRLGFVLHLGDFIYEIVWYPENRASSYAIGAQQLVFHAQLFEQPPDTNRARKWRKVKSQHHGILTQMSAFRKRGCSTDRPQPCRTTTEPCPDTFQAWADRTILSMPAR